MPCTKNLTVSSNRPKSLFNSLAAWPVNGVSYLIALASNLVAMPIQFSLTRLLLVVLLCFHSLNLWAKYDVPWEPTLHPSEETLSSETAPCSFTLASTISNVSCFGGSDGGIEISLTNAVAPISYIWNTGATTEDLVDLTAGSYSVTITDGTGCSVTQNYTITETAVITINLIQSNLSCFGAGDGSLAALVSGGQAPYSYSWSSGGTTPIQSNLSAGTYVLTVSDALGCELSDTAILTQPSEITVTSATSPAS